MMSRQLSAHDIQKGELRDLAVDALVAGFTITPTRNGHLAWYPPNGGSPVHTASTPGDYRSVRNARSRLEQRGLPKKIRGKQRAKKSKLLSDQHLRDSGSRADQGKRART